MVRPVPERNGLCTAAKAVARTRWGRESIGRPGLIFIGLLVLACAIAFPNFSGLDDYNPSLWVFGYDYGFIKRGIVGTITEAMFGHASRTLAFIEKASLLVLGLFFASAAWLCARLVARGPWLGAMAFALLYLSSPGTISYFTSDIGKFDTLNYIFLITAALGLLHQRLPRFLPLGLGILAAIAILVHEAFVFIGLPVLMAMLFVSIEPERVASSFTAFLLPAVLAFMAIAVHGNQTLLSESEFQAVVGSRTDFDVNTLTVHVFYMSFVDNASLAWTHLNKHFGMMHAIMLAAVLPGLLCALYIWAKALRPPHLPGWSLWLLLASTMGPWALFAFGVDHGRWIALFSFNFFLILSWTALKFSPAPTKGCPLTPANYAVSFLIVVFSLASGHLPVVLGMPSGWS